MSSQVAIRRDLLSAGTDLFQQALGAVSDAELTAPTALPGWSRAHVVAHVAANADALVNLVTWARTGQETPMYSSPEQRDADIEAGSALPAARLREWCTASATTLDAALDELEPEHWAQVVRTAQGRHVPAGEVPWMRTREVMVHAVDLGAGVGFADLPTDFLAHLLDDASARRSAAADGPAIELQPSDDLVSPGTWVIVGAGTTLTVRGHLPQLAAYVTGRPHEGLNTDDGSVPELPRWL